MPLRAVAVLICLVYGVAACAPGRGTLVPGATASPPLTGTASPPTAVSAAPSLAVATSIVSPAPGSSPQVIAVAVTDALRIEPAQMTVRVGQPVTFVVTNPGLLNHEFYVGDAAAQAEHEFEMAARHAAVATDTETGIAVGPGQTRELTITFPSAGESLAGCHILNHYVGGMKATITITE